MCGCKSFEKTLSYLHFFPLFYFKSYFFVQQHFYTNLCTYLCENMYINMYISEKFGILRLLRIISQHVKGSRLWPNS